MNHQKALATLRNKIGKKIFERLLAQLQTVNLYIELYTIRWYDGRTLMLAGCADAGFNKGIWILKELISNPKRLFAF